MKMNHISRIVAIAGLSVLLIACATRDLATDTQSLARWQASYDEIRDMTPKWGFQGAEASKASLDAGVDITFVDVRTPQEWAGGIIPGALLLNLNELPSVDKVAMLPADKNAIIAVYCKSGHRATLALTFLHHLGYKNAISMNDGWVGWSKAGYPVAEGPAMP